MEKQNGVRLMKFAALKYKNEFIKVYQDGVTCILILKAKLKETTK